MVRPSQLIVRCYGEKQGSQWSVMCLDFTLAAQGASFSEAKAKLNSQIEEYVTDALGGVDAEHAPYLLYRRAPLVYWLKYYRIRLQAWSRRLVRTHKAFDEALPLVVAHCA